MSVPFCKIGKRAGRRCQASIDSFASMAAATPTSSAIATNLKKSLPRLPGSNTFPPSAALGITRTGMANLAASTTSSANMLKFGILLRLTPPLISAVILAWSKPAAACCNVPAGKKNTCNLKSTSSPALPAPNPYSCSRLPAIGSLLPVRSLFSPPRRLLPHLTRHIPQPPRRQTHVHHIPIPAHRVNPQFPVHHRHPHMVPSVRHVHQFHIRILLQLLRHLAQHRQKRPRLLRHPI